MWFQLKQNWRESDFSRAVFSTDQSVVNYYFIGRMWYLWFIGGLMQYMKWPGNMDVSGLRPKSLKL